MLLKPVPTTQLDSVIVATTRRFKQHLEPFDRQVPCEAITDVVDLWVTARRWRGLVLCASDGNHYGAAAEQEKLGG